MRALSGFARLIPLTRIRHFYCLLRDVERQQVQLTLADELSRRPVLLVKMLEESRRHFALYDNSGEPFHDRPQGGEVSRAFAACHSEAEKAATRLSCGQVSFVQEAPGLGYVDYEVNQVRTTGTGSAAEDGQPVYSSVDLLLRDPSERYPLVGELKAATDRNPFFALIQSLTYAVELSTPAQQERLRRWYPGVFGITAGREAVGVAIISIGERTGSNANEFERLAHALATAVTAGTSGWLRRVTFYDAELPQDDRVHLSVSHSADRR